MLSPEQYAQDLAPAAAEGRSLRSRSAAMRILIVSSNFPPNGWGGAEVAAEGIGRWLAQEGHEVAVYTDSEYPAGAEPTRANIFRWYAPPKRAMSHRTHEHARMSGPRKALWHLRDHAPGSGAREFASAVEAFHPDLVMVHLAPGLGVGLFEHCATRDIPVLYVVHDFWLTCLRSSMFSRNGNVCGTRELLCRVSSSIRWGALSRVERLGFWAPSSRIVEILRAQLGDVFRNVLIERNVVDLEDFEGVRKAPFGDRTRFLYVGKVTEAKGVVFLLECLASLPEDLEFELDILGSGDMETHLKRKYAADKRIRFRGVCARAEVVGYYRDASILVVPSLWFENSPLVVYQAQAAGLPVLGSDSGGIPELLANRGDSLVLAAGDRGAWVSTLGELTSERQRVKRLGAEACALASQGKRVIDERGRRVVELCRSLISGRCN